MASSKTVKVDAEIWEMIVSHYAHLESSTIGNDPDARTVMRYIVKKENARMRHDDFTEAKARFARLRDWGRVVNIYTPGSVTLELYSGVTTPESQEQQRSSIVRRAATTYPLIIFLLKMLRDDVVGGVRDDVVG